jgi:hypothetical protein
MATPLIPYVDQAAPVLSLGVINSALALKEIPNGISQTKILPSQKVK